MKNKNRYLCNRKVSASVLSKRLMTPLVTFWPQCTSVHMHTTTMVQTIVPILLPQFSFAYYFVLLLQVKLTDAAGVIIHCQALILPSHNLQAVWFWFIFPQKVSLFVRNESLRKHFQKYKKNCVCKGSHSSRSSFEQVELDKSKSSYPTCSPQ